MYGLMPVPFKLTLCPKIGLSIQTGAFPADGDGILRKCGYEKIEVC
jgi:hypothetical protein